MSELSLDAIRPPFRRVINDSGLTKIELSKLYGVSRQSIHCWQDTPPRAGSLLARQAEAITVALVSLIDTKRLPLAVLSREARSAFVAKLATTLQNLKPVPVK